MLYYVIYIVAAAEEQNHRAGYQCRYWGLYQCLCHNIYEHHDLKWPLLKINDDTDKSIVVTAKDMTKKNRAYIKQIRNSAWQRHNSKKCPLQWICLGNGMMWFGIWVQQNLFYIDAYPIMKISIWPYSKHDWFYMESDGKWNRRACNKMMNILSIFVSIGTREPLVLSKNSNFKTWDAVLSAGCAGLWPMNI